MAFLAPLFLIGAAAIAVPIIVHLIQRERKDVIEFPSLMFIRRIPYQSVERRRIHNWWLLMLRAGAMLLLVAAFARPFFKQDPVKAAAATSGAREVVILLDRSASMGYGDHWARAQAEAHKVVAGLGGNDQGTLVLFDDGPEETIRATSNRGILDAAIDNAKVTSGSTRYASALRLAQSMLTRSSLPRKEAVLISDFQKSGWQRQEEIHLPEGATITPISVNEVETSDVAVSSVAIVRAAFQNEERVTLTAGITNRGGTPFANLPVKLEIDGRVIGSRNVTVGPNASGSVTFDTVTVSESHMRATVTAGATDKLAANNAFHFVLSPSRPISVLLVQGEGAGSASSLYLTTALDVGKAPPFKTEIVPVSRVSPASFEQRSVVILNDSSALSTPAAERLAAFVKAGGGLFVILGERNPLGTDTLLLPGALGAPVDRAGLRGGTLGYLDYSHKVFEPFKDPRNGNFTNVHFFKYRALTPTATDRVLARFDDGAAAVTERRVGDGRVVAFSSTLEAQRWNDFTNRAIFVPLLHEMVKYLAQYEQPEAWYTVGRLLDISQPIGAIVREGRAGAADSVKGATGIVVSPGGDQSTLGAGGAPSIELAEQGFYSVRLQSASDRKPFAVAVNLDAAESDLSALAPSDFLGSVTGRAAVTATGQSLERPELTPEDIEKKQSIWWFLLVAGIAMLLAESVLANRLSRRLQRA